RVVQGGEVVVLEAHVVGGAVEQALHRGIVEHAHRPGRVAQPQLAAAHHLARGHQRTGADVAVVLDHHAVHHRRAHADQGAIADGAGVHDGAVADGDVVADGRGIAVHARVRAAVADVDDGAVLKVAARADAHVVDVAADHRAGPHGAVVADLHVADDGGGGIDVDAGAERGPDAAVGTDVDGHGRILARL